MQQSTLLALSLCTVPLLLPTVLPPYACNAAADARRINVLMYGPHHLAGRHWHAVPIVWTACRTGLAHTPVVLHCYSAGSTAIAADLDMPRANYHILPSVTELGTEFHASVMLPEA